MTLKVYGERIREFFDSLVNSTAVPILKVTFIIWILVVHVLYYRQYVSLARVVLKKIFGF